METTCHLCFKRFPTSSIKKHQWLCYKTSIETTAAVDIIEQSILTADVNHVLPVETLESPIPYPDQEMHDSLGDTSDHDPLPDHLKTDMTVRLIFPPDIDIDRLAPDNDSTNEEGIGLDENSLFDHVSLANHLGEEDLDPP